MASDEKGSCLAVIAHLYIQYNINIHFVFEKIGKYCYDKISTGDLGHRVSSGYFIH